MKKIFPVLFLFFSGVGMAQPKKSQIAGIKLDHWYGITGLNFASITSPGEKTGERGSYANFSIFDPVDNLATLNKYRNKTASAVFYSADQSALESFRLSIQGKELQDIKLPIISRNNKIFRLYPKKSGTSQDRVRFRAIFPHDNHSDFRNATGKFPVGTKVYYFWAYGVPYKDELIFETEPDPTNYEDRDGAKVYKYFYHSITDRKVSSFVMPRELIIAIAGESNSSGEGAPAAAVPRWLLDECHRSAGSGMYLGVEQFAKDHPEISMVYKDFFVGCSGATIPDLITKSQKQNLPPQFTQLANKRVNAGMENYPIDVLLLSIGGNDVKFSTLAGLLLAPGPILNSGTVRELLGVDIPELLAELRQRYQLLNAAISELKVKKTFVIGYADLTHVNSELYCGMPDNLTTPYEILLKLAEDISQATGDAICPGDCFDTPVLDYLKKRAACLGLNVWDFAVQLVDAILNLSTQEEWEDAGASLGNILAEAGASQKEFRYAYENILIKLNSTIRQLCNELSWGYIDGADRLSVTHGICVCADPYFNTIGESFIIQNDKNGAAHLNRNGQVTVNKAVILTQLNAYLADTLNRREMPSQLIPAGAHFKLTEKSPIVQKAVRLKNIDIERSGKFKMNIKKQHSAEKIRINKVKDGLLKLRGELQKKAARS